MSSLSRALLKVLMVINMVGGAHQFEANPVSAVVARWERRSDYARHLMLFVMVRIMTDLVDSRFRNLVTRLVLLWHCAPFYEAFRLAHRALPAFRALRRRSSGVMLAARALPPIFPPSRPSSDRIWDLRDLAGCSGSRGGRSPNNLCTAMKPAWTSSSGSLPDGFRIHYQIRTVWRMASSLWKTKVAHYLISSGSVSVLKVPT